MPTGATFEDLLALSKLLFVRGDVLGRIADHDRAAQVANEAIASCPPARTRALHPCAARGAFPSLRQEADALLDHALAAGHPEREIDTERAALLQATGRYRDALVLREKLAKDDPGIHTLGALASLLAEMGEWAAAEKQLCSRARCGRRRITVPLQPTALRMGRQRDAPRRLDRAEAILRRTRRDPAAACSGTRTSRRGGARARTVGRRLRRLSRRCSRPLTIRNIARRLRGDPGRTWRQQSCGRSGTRRCSL